MRVGLVLAALFVMSMGVPDRPAWAQQTAVAQHDVLVIDIERLFAETVYGKRLQAGIEAKRDALIARNARVAADLEAEEKALTEKRPATPPDAFREMADAFDAKVTRLRRESDRLSRELERQRERAPTLFMRVVQPVLGEILSDAGAVALLDQRSVILRADAADVTDLAVARIDARVGEGPADSGKPRP